MKRRDFLRTGSAVSLPVLVNGFSIGYLPKSAFFNLIDDNSDRVLVLVQLDGGNDGLNTLIPLDQYANLSLARPELLIPENEVLPIADGVGLHPNMTGMRNMFDDGKMTAIQAVSYPNQNRSHFRSTDIWTTGSSSSNFITTGWLGRYFDQLYPGYPEGYPNAEEPDPFAITVRAQVSETCQGLTNNFSMAVTDPFTLGQVDESTFGQLPDTNFGNEMAFLLEAIAQTNAYSETVLAAAQAGNNLSTMYDDNSGLAQQLRTAALLISGGLKTRVYVVRIGGFDTHANQVNQNDATGGRHGDLMAELSDAIAAFQDDLELLGLEERVLGMTFSEFGRQIKANDGLGTDHGTAAPLFLFGSCVSGGVLGENPEIRADLEPQEGVAMQFDYRSVYASVLSQWFGADASDVAELLFGEFDQLPLVEDCSVTSGIEIETPNDVNNAPFTISVFPNPVAGPGQVELQSNGERVRLNMYDQTGREVWRVEEQKYGTGKHLVPMNIGHLPRGTYYLRAITEKWQETVKVTKM